MKRPASSHKGDNGRVLVIGGNERYHGAPILAGLGAEKSGADLVSLLVPKEQQLLARSFSPNLIVDTFSGSYFRPKDLRKALDLCEKADVLVVGNGMGDRPQTQRALRKLLQNCPCRMVIDAAALVPFVAVAPLPQEVVVTPHRGELAAMGADEEDLVRVAQNWNAIVALKGPTDLIATPDGQLFENTTGHPILTKGGTGDVLAGLIAGLMAQGMASGSAVQQALHDWGKVGEFVATKKGLETTIEELIQEI